MPCNLEPSTKRHKAQARIALLFVLIALALTVLPTASFAGTDTAGNVLATEADSNPSSAEGDLYWAGQRYLQNRNRWQRDGSRSARRAQHR